MKLATDPLAAPPPRSLVSVRFDPPLRREFWKCRCGRTLAERADDRLIIKEGKTTVIAAAPFNVGRTCPKCGLWNDYVEVVVTSLT